MGMKMGKKSGKRVTAYKGAIWGVGEKLMLRAGWSPEIIRKIKKSGVRVK